MIIKFNEKHFIKTQKEIKNNIRYEKNDIENCFKDINCKFDFKGN